MMIGQPETGDMKRPFQLKVAWPAPPPNPTEDTRQHMREMALSSLYYMAKTVLGYTKLRPEPHGDLCQFLDFIEHSRLAHDWSFNRTMTLAPRDTYKTTVGTIVRAIQRACRDPNTRGLIVADTAENAERFGSEIGNHFQYNHLLRWLFSEIVPDNFNKVKWSAQQMILNRESIHREPTFDLIGAFGGIESRHYDWIIADDLVTEKCIHSDAEMDRLIGWIGGLEPLLVSDVESFIDFVGSRKKKGDPYEAIEKYYDDGTETTSLGPHAEKRGGICVYSRAIIEDGKNIFPYVPEKRSGISDAYIERMRVHDPERYWAQLANSPKASGINTFDFECVRFFTMDDRGMIEARLEGKLLHRVDVWNVGRIIVYDPSVAERKSSSMQAIHVIAKGAHPFRFVVESRVGHFPPDEAIDLLFELDEKWRPSLISIEKRGFQGWVKYWLADRAELLGKPYPPVVEWPPEGSQKAQWAKTEHIRALQPPIRAGYFWFLPDQHELLEQIEFYPNVRWDDGLDALAQHLDYAPMSDDAEVQGKRDQAERTLLKEIGGGDEPRQTVQAWDEKKFLEQLDQTGYGLRVG